MSITQRAGEFMAGETPDHARVLFVEGLLGLGALVGAGIMMTGVAYFWLSGREALKDQQPDQE